MHPTIDKASIFPCMIVERNEEGVFQLMGVVGIVV
jgi:hypothetical protein